MGKVTEPLDSLAGRIALGIHLVATAVLCSANASREEIALAGEILKRDPPRSLPRELAGAIETFNRHMDAALESANASAGCATRAERRAQLASALERAGLVMIEQSTLAELLSRKLAAGADPLEDEEPFDGDELDVPLLSAEEQAELKNGMITKINTRAGGLNYVELEDDDFITVYGGPIGGSLADAAEPITYPDYLEGAARSAELNSVGQ